MANFRINFMKSSPGPSRDPVEPDTSSMMADAPHAPEPGSHTLSSDGAGHPRSRGAPSGAWSPPRSPPAVPGAGPGGAVERASAVWGVPGPVPGAGPCDVTETVKLTLVYNPTRREARKHAVN